MKIGGFRLFSWLSRASLLKRFTAFAIVGAVLLLLLSFIYLLLVIRRIDDRMAQLKATQPTVFFGTFPPLRINQTFFKGQLKQWLQDQGYIEKPPGSDLMADEFAWEAGAVGKQLIVSRGEHDLPGYRLERITVRLTLEEQNNELTIKSIDNTERSPDAADGDGQPLTEFQSRPKKIAAYYGGRIRNQNPIALSDMPVAIRHAVMAIEDAKFLEHSGVSIRGTVRALWRDLVARRWVEGGSTITQQLMKNLFFSREKALQRKLREALYAFVTESRYSKEEILEAYLNEVYMGQWSTHEIHGVAEGALYYFNRDISQITLGQSATLAAIIQAPNAQDPKRYPDRTLKRRNLVLKKMLDVGFILNDEYTEALAQPLEVIPTERSLDDIDYFLDLLMSRLPADVVARFDHEALAVYTSLNPYLQSAASSALRRNLQRIHDLSPAVRELEKKGIRVQSALIAIDVPTCSVLALQGGRSYRQTQFNRVLQGKRQPGSLFKTFVYLAAFDPEVINPPYTPVTEIEDEPFEWKYDNQVWTPKNYDDKFRGTVLTRQALQESLNVPTAKIAEKVGIVPIVDVMRKAGIRSPLAPLPSLSLGSAEVTPIELAESYGTLARLGKMCTVAPFSRVVDSGGNLILDGRRDEPQTLSAPATYQVVQVLKGVFTVGTARSSVYSKLNLEHFAGKTGTTNEYKDAWFAGFSPDLLALVWVGYDEEAKIGLTGGAAALPLWLDFIRQAKPVEGTEDFKVPEGIAAYQIDSKNKLQSTNRCPHSEIEYFIRGTEPGPCLAHP